MEIRACCLKVLDEGERPAIVGRVRGGKMVSEGRVW